MVPRLNYGKVAHDGSNLIAEENVMRTAFTENRAQSEYTKFRCELTITGL